MRTIQRHFTGPRGDFQAMCDYCGVMWYRSKLTRDAAGYLRCPRESGKDHVTLTKENTLWSRRERLPIRDGGNLDKGGDNYEANPYSILTTPFGWWQIQQAGTVGAVGFQMIPNLVALRDPQSFGNGNVMQSDPTLQPVNTDNEGVFDGDYLRSRPDLVTAAGEFVTIWAKGSFDDDAEGTDTGMVAYAGAAASIGETDARGIELYYNATAETLTLRAVYADPSGGGGASVETVVVPFSDNDPHLFKMKVGDGTLALTIDSTTYTTTISSTANGLFNEHNIVTFGGAHRNDVTEYGLYGVLDEVVIVGYESDSDEDAAMQTYFANTYSDLTL